MVPGVYNLLCLQEEKVATLFFLHIELHNHQSDLNPCLWLYYGNVITELEKNTNKKDTVHGACNLTKLHFKILIYLFLISNNVGAILRDYQQITFVTLNRFCPLSKPYLPIPMFLMDKTKLDGIPSKSKWKIHLLWYIVVPRFWRYFL